MSADFAELAGHDAYDLLGVDADATPAEIRQAFRALAKENHPDLFPEPRAKAAAEVRIRLLNAARDVLQHRRADYDAFRSAPYDLDDEFEDTEIVDDPWADAAPGAPPPPDPWANAGVGPVAPPDPWETTEPRRPPPPPPFPPPPPPRPIFNRSVRRRSSPLARIGIGCSVTWGIVWLGAILIVLLAAVLPDHGPQPSVAVPARFAGTWAGTVQDVAKRHDDGEPVRWKAEVTLKNGRHNGKVRYLDGKCSGTAVPLAFGHDRLTVNTVFGSSQTGCDVGDMHLAVRKNGRLDLSYLDKNGKVTASGVLTRR
ncbi:J domain-containing protein [Actinoallomurus soli]|uniref:J domain-containing protein n=1 Tax=Actinoallomurus soli TaxID=2952535 RepID=UPI002093E834|nr:J domain-containing protein [Actinoallomurus soli]MCO5968985.1 J domain-containing protein [Actinoallomurus soli]